MLFVRYAGALPGGVKEGGGQIAQRRGGGLGQHLGVVQHVVDVGSTGGAIECIGGADALANRIIVVAGGGCSSGAKAEVKVLS